MTKQFSFLTEALIIISQTSFFIMLFFIIKGFLLDNFNIMNDALQLKKNALLVASVYFSIIVVISIFMLPLINYEFALIVIIGVICGVFLIIYRDISTVLSGKKNESEGTKTKTKPKPQPQTTPTSADTILEF